MMNRFLVGSVVLFAAVIGLRAQSDPTPSKHPAAQQQVRAAEQTWVELWNKCDATTVSRVMSDDFSFIHGTGALDDKTRFLKMVTGCALHDIRADIQQVRVYDDKAAIVVGILYLTASGKPLQFIYTHSHVRKNGAWIMTSHQGTFQTTPAK